MDLFVRFVYDRKMLYLGSEGRCDSTRHRSHCGPHGAEKSKEEKNK